MSICDRNIGVEFSHHYTFQQCRNYITNEDKPDFNIKSESNYDKGSIHNFLTFEGFNSNALFVENSIRAEYYNILQQITLTLIDYSIILLHGATIAHSIGAYLFTAPSGTGKTTHILKWLSNYPEAFVVNGDKTFLKFEDDGTVLACGSPWAGKENMHTNTMVPLKAIVLMERAEDNHIEQISFAEAFPFLLQQVYRPEDEEKMRKTLRLMQRLGKSATFWRFQCNNFKDDCFQVAYEALVGKSL